VGGFATPEPRRPPKSAGTRFCAEQADERWRPTSASPPGFVQPPPDQGRFTPRHKAIDAVADPQPGPLSLPPNALISRDDEVVAAIVADGVTPRGTVRCYCLGAPNRPSVRKSALEVAPVPSAVPLTGRLSNRQFTTNLSEMLGASSCEVPAQGRTTAPACCCGCGQGVAKGRKFVNQDHYSGWLSRLRYFGRNRRD
jgi:hypothetical protein